tara:strand:- start:3879 stop:4037 length:159 start_codon:yes stop_codon:yes gene_type:complete
MKILMLPVLLASIPIITVAKGLFPDKKAKSRFISKTVLARYYYQLSLSFKKL